MKVGRTNLLVTSLLTALICASVSRGQVSITGFGNGSGFTLNSNGSSPTISSGVLTLTTNNSNEARSAFYNTPVAAAPFSAQFIYQTSGSKDADGIAFVIENDPRGVNARGGYGSGLGYGNSDEDPGAPIASSVAFEINIFSGHTRGINVQTDGTYTGAYAGTGSVAFNSGHQIQVNLTYNGSLLSTTIEDLTTLQTYQTSYNIGSLSTLLGGTTGYVGFTGATGSQMSIQTISGFSFTSVPEPSSVALLALGVSALSVGFWRRRLGR